MARVHVVIPDEILKDIDELAGERGRSRFITEAAEARARKEKLLKAIREGAGSVDVSKHPEWATAEKVAQWVRDLRDTPSIRRDPLLELLARERAEKRAKKTAKSR
jgi:metal-responsive CopG/Arc/MetJ family transcriptional regulator